VFSFDHYASALRAHSQADLAFLQKDLTYEKPFFQFLREHVLPLFHGHERPERHYLRVVPKEQTKSL
jgi:hypothetical protein